YVQDYLEKYGARKCEANALVVIPEQARELVREAIEHYLGQDAEQRFIDRWQVVSDEMEKLRDDTGVRESVEEAILIIEEQEP
ncbi:unnamed protein product, partial [marine sediment metagenome]